MRSAPKEGKRSMNVDTGTGDSGCDKYQSEYHQRELKEPNFNKLVDEFKQALSDDSFEIYNFGLNVRGKL